MGIGMGIAVVAFPFVCLGIAAIIIIMAYKSKSRPVLILGIVAILLGAIGFLIIKTTTPVQRVEP